MGGGSERVGNEVKEEETLKDVSSTSAACGGMGKPCHAIPSSFLCSICYLPMLDPVATEFGHSYDRKCIKHWLLNAAHSTNPRDGRTLVSLRLVDSVDLCHVIKLALSQLEPFRSAPRDRWQDLLETCDWDPLPGAAFVDSPPATASEAGAGSGEELLPSSEAKGENTQVGIPELPVELTGAAVLGWVQSIRLLEGSFISQSQLGERLSGKWEGFYYQDLAQRKHDGKMSITFYGTVGIGEDDCGPFSIFLEPGQPNQDPSDFAFLKRYTSSWRWSYRGHVINTTSADPPQLVMHGLWGYQGGAGGAPWALVKKEGLQAISKVPPMPSAREWRRIDNWLACIERIGGFPIFVLTLSGRWRGFSGGESPSMEGSALMLIDFEGGRGRGSDAGGSFKFEPLGEREQEIVFTKKYDSSGEVDSVYSAAVLERDGKVFMRGKFQSRHRLFDRGIVAPTPWALVKDSQESQPFNGLGFGVQVVSTLSIGPLGGRETYLGLW